MPWNPHGTGDADALITYAAALVTKYGEGSAALAADRDFDDGSFFEEK